ncbi:MAG: hypothetical protein ACR2MP_13690 [Streptosporangiaceae bacterium]
MTALAPTLQAFFTDRLAARLGASSVRAENLVHGAGQQSCCPGVWP